MDNKKETDSNNEYSRIPKIFCSSETGKPFDHCMVCNKYLLQDRTSYVLEKAIRQFPELNVKEVMFEYAICLECMIKLNEAMSSESRERIQTYMATHIDFIERRNNLLNKEEQVGPWIDRCLVKNTMISKSSEYQLTAQFEGKHLVYEYMPFALSGEALEEISMLLSEKTRDEMDDFIGKYFSGPPEVAKLLRNGRFFLV